MKHGKPAPVPKLDLVTEDDKEDIMMLFKEEKLECHQDILNNIFHLT